MHQLLRNKRGLPLIFLDCMPSLIGCSYKLGHVVILYVGAQSLFFPCVLNKKENLYEAFTPAYDEL